MIKEKRTLDFITSASCNINCSYCFLCNKQAHKDEDLKIKESLENGSFLKNIENTLNKMSISRDEFDTWFFWGGEPTLYLPIFSFHIKKVLNDFKNITIFSLSTNMVNSADNIISFIKSLEENSDRKITLGIQVSLDGDNNILEKTRGVKYESIQENIYKIIDYVNFAHLKKVTISFHFKSTLSFNTIKEIGKTKQNIIDYLSFFDNELIKIEDKSITKNFNLNHGHTFASPGIVNPEKYTVEDGIQAESIARLCDAIDLSKFKYFDKANLAIDFILDHHRDEKTNDYNLQVLCLNGITHLVFRYDGSLTICTSSFMEDREEYLQYIEKYNKESYKKAPLYTNLYIDPKAENFKEKIKERKIIADNYAVFSKNITAAMIYELAECKQASSIYLNNPSILAKHASLASIKAGCPYWNITRNGDLFIPSMDYLRLVCNGLISYYYERSYYNNADY